MKRPNLDLTKQQIAANLVPFSSLQDPHFSERNLGIVRRIFKAEP